MACIGVVVLVAMRLTAQDSSLHVFKYQVTLRATEPSRSGPVTLLSLTDSGAYVLNTDLGSRRALLPATPDAFVPVEHMIRFRMERRGGKGRGAAVGIGLGYLGGYLLARANHDKEIFAPTFWYGTLFALPLGFIGKGIGRGQRSISIQGSRLNYQNEMRVLERALPQRR